jgi:type IV pilus assembly protein PilA
MINKIRDAMEDKESGFTLIELLVVIIIIGILAAAAVPVFLNQRKKGNDANMKSDLHSVSLQVESFFTTNNMYPTTGQIAGAGVVAAAANVGASMTITVAAGAAGPPIVAPILETIAISPGNTIEYVQATVAAGGVSAGYCINATRTAGAQPATGAWVYNSMKGGLQPANTAVYTAANCA